jgi:hypothetical protein
MSTLVSCLPEGPIGGLAALGLNLLVALGLVAVSFLLGIALSLLIGLPAVIAEPARAVRARLNRVVPR